MRILIATESFLPTLNGVTTSVCRVAEGLRDLGHETLLVAPGRGEGEYAGARVRGLPSVRVREFPVGVPTPALRRAVRDFRPDVLHAASPFVLSARALTVARQHAVPSVAIFQTDVPAYLAQHAPGAVGRGASDAAWRWLRRTHARAGLTLAPSEPTLRELRAHGIPRTALWRRGVDTSLFRPGLADHPDTVALRRLLAPRGELLLGYVGRLAPEKELHRLAELADLPGTRLVVVGDGPSRGDVGADLTRAVADAPGRPNLPPVFLGRREGHDLAVAYAALDVFVHTGTRETFGQTLQEAAATALPVVAPARGGPLDLVDHGRTGLLFDPDVAGSLRAQVARLVAGAGPGERLALGRAAHAAVAGRTWGALTRELVGHYEHAGAGGCRDVA